MKIQDEVLLNLVANKHIIPDDSGKRMNVVQQLRDILFKHEERVQEVCQEPLKVFLLEDNPVILRALEVSIASHCCCSIKTASSLQESYSFIYEKFDLIISDIELGDGTSFSFLKEYEKHHEDSKYLTVINTSTYHEEYFDQCVAMNIKHRFVKGKNSIKNIVSIVNKLNVDKKRQPENLMPLLGT